MQMQEKKELMKKYAQMSDEELKELLSEGKEAYREGVYELLLDEGAKRGIEEEARQIEKEGEELKISEAQVELKVPTYVELVILVEEADVAFLTSLLEKENIRHYFQSLSFKGRDLPASLMVEESKTEEVIGLLKDFKPKGGVVLW